MDASKYTERVLEVLAEERASHGHGAAAEIDQKLGRAEGYLGRVLRGEVRLPVEMLFRILTVLGSDPAEFFSRVCGPRQVNAPWLLARLECQGRQRKIDPLLQKVEHDLLHLEYKEEDSAEQACGESPIETLLKNLEELDCLRFTRPSETKQGSNQALAEAIQLAEENPSLRCLEVLCLALGVVASIHRIDARFQTAAQALRLAFSLVEAGQLKVVSRAGAERLMATRAQLLQRASYLIRDQGDYTSALELARQTSDLYLQLDDRAGIGKSLVDRALVLSFQGEFFEALRAYRKSLDYLNGEHWRNRFSAFQGMGQLYTQLGRINEAQENCAKARKTHLSREGQNWWRLIWLQGEIALKEKDLGKAEECFQSVRGSFIHQSNALDSAAVSLRLAKVFLLQDRHLDVQNLASEMIMLLKPLRKQKMASAAIHEFARAALTGQVTVAFLDKLCRKIKHSNGFLRIGLTPSSAAGGCTATTQR